MSGNKMKPPKLHSGYMEVAVAGLIGYRTCTIVPNVSWGLGLKHECDMLALDANGRFTEIEIKVSKQDLKADAKKPHGHSSNIISRLVYAVPDGLSEYAMLEIPKHCGLISVKWDTRLNNFKASWVKQCKHNKAIGKPSVQVISKFMSLGCMRIWSLKTALYKKKCGTLRLFDK